MTAEPILCVEGLRTHFRTHDGVVRAVDGVDLELRHGEILGLVGESGCGKTVTALSLLRLIEPPGEIAGGRIAFEGQDLLRLSKAEIVRLRGAGIGMIFQQPRGSLNPVIRVGRQIAEQLVRRRGLSRAEAAREAINLLAAVRIPAPEKKAQAYPHELSGGQAQRVMIAIALSLRPALLIADEPTTALDVTVQAEVLDLLRERCKELGTAVILVTHDLGVVAEVADRVAVMYAGRIVEEAPTATLLAAPRHPYTRGLLASIPTPGARVQRLAEIPGVVPALTDEIASCAFFERCTARVERGVVGCERMPPLVHVSPVHRSRCWMAQQGASP
jgi:peptide/nickel transport system ATP-binding protein